MGSSLEMGMNSIYSVCLPVCLSLSLSLPPSSFEDRIMHFICNNHPIILFSRYRSIINNKCKEEKEKWKKEREKMQENIVPTALRLPFPSPSPWWGGGRWSWGRGNKNIVFCNVPKDRNSFRTNFLPTEEIPIGERLQGIQVRFWNANNAEESYMLY